MSPRTEGLAMLLGMLMLPALLQTSVKRFAAAVAILNATVSTHVNSSRKRHWTGLNVMKWMNKGCKNSWTKTSKKQ
jgi:predicted sugar kinase